MERCFRAGKKWRKRTRNTSGPSPASSSQISYRSFDPTTASCSGFSLSRAFAGPSWPPFAGGTYNSTGQSPMSVYAAQTYEVESSPQNHGTGKEPFHSMPGSWRSFASARPRLINLAKTTWFSPQRTALPFGKKMSEPDPPPGSRGGVRTLDRLPQL